MKNKKIVMGVVVGIVAIISGFFIYNKVNFDKIVSAEQFLPNTTLHIGNYETDASLKTANEMYNNYISMKDDNVIISLEGNDYTYSISDCFQHSITIDFFKQEIQNSNFMNYVIRGKNTIEIEDLYTYVNGAKKVYNEYINNGNIKTMTITLGGKEYTMDISKCYNHELTESKLESLLSNYQPQDELNVEDKLTYKGGIEEIVEVFFETTNYNFTPTQDAKIDLETISIIPEVQGNEIDIEKAKRGVRDAIKSGTFAISFDNNEYYKEPEVTKEELEVQYADLFKLAEWYVSYDKDICDYTIKMSDYMSYVTIEDDGTFTVDYSFLKNAVYGLSKQIDSWTNDSMTFKSTVDGTIEVTGGTYGMLMYDAKECEVLEEMIKNGESQVDRQPEWKLSPEVKKNPMLYIEVDKSEQHVWHYVDGKLCCESDCVTGTKGSHDTPTGVFYISEKDPGCYLVGADYKTWVNRWMRLTGSGVGLHDADWRSSFGGSIYTYNGSHGCVNLPPKFAYHLYDTCPMYTMVVVHI